METTKVVHLLTKEEAELRFAITKQGIKYRFFFNFLSGANYSGIVEVTFAMNEGKDTWLDYNGEAVHALWINGKEIDKENIEFKDYKIWLRKNNLNLEGDNIVTVHFENKYSRDGDGLPSYTDNEGKQYLYTQSEPFDGNRVVPLFDQPDLKATYELFATGPTDWNIVTSEVQIGDSTFGEFLSGEIEEGDLAGDFLKIVKDIYKDNDKERKFFRFKTTKILSTYLNNIVGGPYVRYDAPESELYRGIPMAVYCRANLSKYVETQLHDIFAFHAKGIEFYEKFFSFDYPFSKCDAIFCAEYSMGAMEYPGSITYSEQRYFYRKVKPSKFEVSNRGRVILHELAHMWFGNAVTMKWWNGLWLNESFADFSCFQAWEGVREILDFPVSNGWIAFLDRKGWAFKEDQERTTHPIACSVAHTEEANHIFDGITYPKGAMCMRQLMILLGKNTFSKALGDYFQKHQWGNTVLDDLFNACKGALGEEHQGEAYDIDKWREAFLDNPGMNVITSEWDPNATGEATLIVKQSAAMKDHPTLRYHRIGIAFYGANGEVLETKDVILNNSEVTEVTYNADLNPTAVFLNHGDWAFLKIVFDENSYTSLKQNFNKLDALSKALFIRSRFDGVRDAKIPVQEFLDTFHHIWETEEDNEVLHYLHGRLGLVLAKYTPSASYSDLVTKFFNTTCARLTAAEDFDTISLFKKAFTGFMYSEEAIEQAKNWLEGTSDIKHDLSLREKWLIVQGINASSKYTDEQKKTSFDTLAAEDTTDTKDEFKLRIDAMTADAETRQKIFDDYVGCEVMSFKEMQFSMTGFKSKWVSKELKEAYFDQYFEKLMEVKKNQTYQFFKTWRYYLFPSTQNKKFLIGKIKEFIAQIENDSVLLKSLTQVLDDEERSAKVLGIEF